MDHNHYGQDGIPLACRSANTDPVTGLPLPRIPQSDRSEGTGNPFVLPTVLACMLAFAIFFASEANFFG